MYIRKGSSNGCITSAPDLSQSDLNNINDLFGPEDGNNTIEVGF